DQRNGLHLTGRIQWRDDKGSALTLSPFFFINGGRSHRESRFEVPEFDPNDPALPLYDHAVSDNNGHFSMLRLNSQWNQRLANGARLELRGGIGRSTNANHTLRHELDLNDVQTRLLDDATEIHDTSYNLTTKLSKLFDNDHSLVSGAELEGTRRNENRVTEQTTALRGTERLDAGDGEGGSVVSNRSQVWTPLAHAVWKPDPKSRDQVRISLTRSYRAPTLQN